jgi:hypothetical protein
MKISISIMVIIDVGADHNSQDIGQSLYVFFYMYITSLLAHYLSSCLISGNLLRPISETRLIMKILLILSRISLAVLGTITLTDSIQCIDFSHSGCSVRTEQSALLIL